MVLRELQRRVGERTGTKYARVARVLAVALEEISAAVHRGERIHLPGFGSFRPKHRRAGRNAAKVGEVGGETVATAAFVTLGFRAARKQKRRSTQ